MLQCGSEQPKCSQAVLLDSGPLALCPGIADASPLSMHLSTPFPYRIMASFCKHTWMLPEGLLHRSALGPAHEPGVLRNYPGE